MKKLILAILLIACSASHAQFMVLRTQKVSITLTPNPCPEEVREILRPEFKDKFHEAWLIVNGRAAVVCWIKNEEHGIVFLTETGESFAVDPGQFKADKGV